MITDEYARTFAQEWIAAWNARDLDQLLSYYTDDFVNITPMAMLIKPNQKVLLKASQP
ncbi:hypothetical protein BH09BAC4_BH09BAC4_07420 [soil metagenome]